MPELLEPGTLVTYWGQAAGGKYYGKQFTIEFANVCGCKHQTYSIIDSNGNQLSQALAEFLEVIDE